MKNIIIYGAGSVGKLTAQIISDINSETKIWNILGYLDDNSDLKGKVLSNGLKVLGSLTEFDIPANTSIAVTFNDPQLRSKAVEKLKDLNLEIPSLIHPKSWIADRVTLGNGAIIYPYVCIDCDVQIGAFSIINKSVTIGHDSSYGDFLTVSPGVNLGGFLKVGSKVQFGIGASTIQNLSIGSDTIIGAGAVVTSSLPAGCTAVGIPAKPVKFHNP
jgi:sugar O-acyltransferase (sialic acid O-acetyltransferase NeuD family)